LKSTFDYNLNSEDDNNMAIALSWIGILDIEHDTSIAAMFKLNWAKCTNDIISSMKSFNDLSASFVYGTSGGDIGMWTTGKVPRRNAIRDSLYLRNGELRENDWQGFYSIEDNPHVLNPKKGFISVCGGRINPDLSAFYGIGTTVPSTAQALRAYKLTQGTLKRVGKANIDYMKALQSDITDLFAGEIIEKMIEVVNKYKAEYYTVDSKEDEVLSKLCDMLLRWTGEVRNDSKYALIYSMWHEEVFNSLFTEQLSFQERQLIKENVFKDYFLEKMLMIWKEGYELDSKYCNNLNNKNIRYKCPYNVIHSLLTVYNKVVNIHGNNKKYWKFGYESLSEHKHLPFSDWFTLRLLFHRVSFEEVF